MEVAEFKIYNEKGLVGSGKTNKDGLLIFENISYGIYQIEEVKAPKGYFKIEEKQTFTFDSKNKIFELTNQKHNMPITSDMDQKYYQASLVSFLLGIILFYVSKTMH